MNTKNWNPVTWAIATERMEYIKMFYENLEPHLTHAIDINPFLSIFSEDIQLNKGRMKGLIYAIQMKNWDIFKYIMDKTYRFLTGWHAFNAFRAFVDS